MPGSGFLRFDGIPFSSKLEFLAVAISTVAVLSPEFRTRCRTILAKNGGHRRGWVTTLLAAAILLKLFTYALLPLGDGFEACYRSIYEPLEQENACERSYEAPFLTRDSINGFNSITRMEPTINFGRTGDRVPDGASNTTWKLPFANDYPRLGTLWLDRLPFTAKFGSMINVREESVIPIQFVGELTVNVDQQQYMASSYEHSALILIPVPKGEHVLRIDYKFADLDSPVIPDEPPPIRGPWAQLFVGRQRSTKSALTNLKLNVRGHAINQDLKETPQEIEVRTKSGEIVASAQTYVRPDVADHFEDKRYEKSGFTLTVADVDGVNRRTEFQVFAIYESGRESYLGKIGPSARGGGDLAVPLRTLDGQYGSTSDFEVWHSIEQNEFAPLVPVPSAVASGLWALVLRLIDLLALTILMCIAGLAVVNLRGKILALVGLSLWFFLCNWAVSYFKLSWWGYQSIVVPLLVAFGLAFALWRNPSLNLIGALIGASVAVTNPVLQLLRAFEGLGSAPWWGFQLFRGRDSDWFVAQGYARQIFVETSLRGGEGLFYFQPGVRYFAFIQHLLFGENDVLLTILMNVGVLVAAIFACREAARRFPKRSMYLVVAVFISACFVVFTEQILVVFASAPSSEYPTWILIMLIFGFILRGGLSHNQAVVLTGLAGLTAQFRPNQVFGAICLFILIQLEMPAGRGVEQLISRLRLILVFGSVLSLSLLHNLHYGESFTIFSSTGPLNNDLEFTSLLKIFNDGNIREIVFYKLRLALYWGWSSDPVAVVFRLLQMLWFLAVIKAIRLKNVGPKVWVALIFPLTYLIPHLPYDFIGSYYPRHIVAIQLAFGLSALYIHRSCEPASWHLKRQQMSSTAPTLENAWHFQTSRRV